MQVLCLSKLNYLNNQRRIKSHIAYLKTVQEKRSHFRNVEKINGKNGKKKERCEKENFSIIFALANRIF